MKLSVTVMAFLGHIKAIENTEAGSDTPRAVWINVDRNEYTRNEKVCQKQTDCAGVDMVCIDHRWEYNDQWEAATGCWHKSVCSNKYGNQSFTMFDDRKIQWFCSDEAKAKALGVLEALSGTDELQKTDAGEKVKNFPVGLTATLAYPIQPYTTHTDE